LLAAETLESPDPGADVSADRGEIDSDFLKLSTTPAKSAEESDDPIAAFKAPADIDAQLKAHQRALNTANQRIDDARRSGASLYLTDMNPRDFDFVLRHSPDLVQDWLEGSNEVTADFRRRVRLAEGAYLALCEALLAHDAQRGVALWRGLRRALTTLFVGRAGAEEMLHIPFRVPNSPPVAELRTELIGLNQSHTDRALLNLAIAAQSNDSDEWLSKIIADDRMCPLPWRRMRSWVLEGFNVNNTLPVADAWRDGEIKTSHDGLRRWSAQFRYREACAHYWWLAYWEAKTPSETYAAWITFLRSADRRALVWMDDDARVADDASALYRPKINHLRLNRSELRRAMEKQEDGLDKEFLKRDTVPGLGPWTGMDT
jgi:hypothetical protein